MNTSAIITMLLTQVTVTGLMVYFFFKVLKAPKKTEPDSFSDNDDEPNE